MQRGALKKKKSADVRRLMRDKKGASAERVQHPLATYTAAGVLQCKVCAVPVKAWQVHLTSRSHIARLQELKARAEKKKRKEHGKGELSTVSGKKRTRDEALSSSATAAPSAGLSAQKPESAEIAESGENVHVGKALPADFFDSAPSQEQGERASAEGESASKRRKTSEREDAGGAVQRDLVKELNEEEETTTGHTTTVHSTTAASEGGGGVHAEEEEGGGALPVGFFDDVERDKKMRGVPKPDAEAELKELEKAADTAAAVQLDEEMLENVTDADAMIVEQLAEREEAEQQAHVAAFLDLKRELEQRKLIGVGRAAGEEGGQKQHGNSNGDGDADSDSDSSESELDEMELFDWRTKSIAR